MKTILEASIYILTTIISLSVSGYACPLKNISFVTENLAPFNYIEKDGVFKGIAIDILYHTAKKLKCKRNQVEINFMPWARAYKESISNKRTVIFTLAKSEEREKLFKWSSAFIETGMALFLHNQLKTDDFNSLKSIGTIINDYAASLLNENLKHKAKIIYSNNIDSLALMFIKKRVDGALYELITFKWILHKNGFKEYHAHKINMVSGHFGFSKDIESNVIEEFNYIIDNSNIINNYIRDLN
ncbi:transporter substrate-binding domain-containing protein [Endozoicomonas sp. SM1973]|uniref:Transporter substrate-binding domain-containing protein n=1 Tax=Spartinivicinus marinus TaxID=2994442 RepID=A0A853I5Y7_9GAMM|nr:transporter substrate-binding domain-containing protein [Spartinivicinus marinus]MCX4025954.1 transporter substrate-binding domain-containing protein [Spartinivicinus marinus]NYZ68139.1 transporter substrate-binding domain-containing protein [Spartinivicinus marinus]